MERLQKLLARAGIASRRQSEELIKDGRVKVNGKTVTGMGIKIDPLLVKVEVDGRPITLEKKVYYLLNKPAGYVTTVKDTHGRPTVIDLMEGVKERVYPVGRLDYDTEGLLLMTNDGELTLALTHPRHEVPKTYRALVKGVPGEEALAKLRKGIVLDDGITAPAQVYPKGTEKGNTTLEITIHEGRKRQIRRMCKAVGHPVLYLQRIKLGFLNLRGLTIGALRPLKPEEVAKLRLLAGLETEHP